MLPATIAICPTLCSLQAKQKRCSDLNSYTYRCVRGYSVDYRSFIGFECEKAVRDDLKIVVIYNSSYVDKNKCSECIRHKGKHIPARTPYTHSWNYEAIKKVILY